MARERSVSPALRAFSTARDLARVGAENIARLEGVRASIRGPAQGVPGGCKTLPDDPGLTHWWAGAPFRRQDRSEDVLVSPSRLAVDDQLRTVSRRARSSVG